MAYVNNVLAGVSDDQWLTVQRRVMEALEPTVSPPPPEQQQIQNIIPQASTSTSVSATATASLPISASLPVSATNLQQLPLTITTAPFPTLNNYRLIDMQPMQPMTTMTVVETQQLDTPRHEAAQQRDSIESVQTDVLNEFLRSDAPERS